VTIEEKYKNLLAVIGQYPSAAVAFSGGVDSTLLCKAAHDALGENAAAVTFFSSFIPQRERDLSKEMARSIGIGHSIIEQDRMTPQVLANPADRCYHCKKAVFGQIAEKARALGMEFIFDGSNTDDLKDYRPGMKALEELSVKSPLREAGFSKQDVRELSRYLGLKTWDMPAYACLASRIPYGSEITDEKLTMVEKGEEVLHELGFRQIRLRHHGDIARIEPAPEEMDEFLKPAVREKVSRALKEIGFTYVCMELEGYKMGSLNVFDEKKEVKR